MTGRVKLLLRYPPIDLRIRIILKREITTSSEYARWLAFAHLLLRASAADFLEAAKA